MGTGCAPVTCEFIRYMRGFPRTRGMITRIPSALRVVGNCTALIFRCVECRNLTRFMRGRPYLIESGLASAPKGRRVLCSDAHDSEHVLHRLGIRDHAGAG